MVLGEGDIINKIQTMEEAITGKTIIKVTLHHKILQVLQNTFSKHN